MSRSATSMRSTHGGQDIMGVMGSLVKNGRTELTESSTSLSKATLTGLLLRLFPVSFLLMRFAGSVLSVLIQSIKFACWTSNVSRTSMPSWNSTVIFATNRGNCCPALSPSYGFQLSHCEDGWIYARTSSQTRLTFVRTPKASNSGMA